MKVIYEPNDTHMIFSYNPRTGDYYVIQAEKLLMKGLAPMLMNVEEFLNYMLVTKLKGESRNKP
jgi:hypothetical protein